MKKLSFIIALSLLTSVAFSSGLLTNTNQSAQFIRMMSRNASLGIDAVYFNPAGLIKLQDGWHFAVNNQSIFQTKTVDSKFLLLNNKGYYEGKVSAPVFPSGFAVYKNDKWAYSFGFGPIGGGGAAEFGTGLPSFEIPISKAAAGLSALGVSGYDADLYFEGSSIFWGLQLGATYKINDIISVFGGVRYMPSINKYVGTISDIKFKVGGETVGASAWLGAKSAGLQALADMPAALQPALSTGGSYTLSQLEGAGAITAQKRAGIEAGLKLMRLSQVQIDAMDLNTIYGAYVQASPSFKQKADALAAGANGLKDKKVDTEQTGAGITPIIGINISPNDDWNIGIKYEHKTYMTLTNKTKVDDLKLFPDGGKVNSDVPGFLAIGIGYRGIEKLEVQFSYNTYLNKGVDWGYNIRSKAHRKAEKNGYDIALGLQYNFTDNFAFSIGGLYSDSGVADSYHSDFSNTFASFTPAAGFEWKVTNKLTLDAGVSNTYYTDSEVTFTDPDVGAYKETYGKSTLVVAVGLSYSIFK
jgi:long-subunit fatty acid transport protein